MGQFFIDEVGNYRFNCDCGEPMQPIIDTKQKKVTCKRCKKHFPNPFHEKNPYNINRKFLFPLKIQGGKLPNPYEIIRIILIISILFSFSFYLIDYYFTIPHYNLLPFEIFIPTILVAIITLVSMVSIFAIFGKNRILESRIDIAKKIEAIIQKYTKKTVSLHNITSYKFDINVLNGLRKDNIANDDWFNDFLHIETSKNLERKIIEQWLRRILNLGIFIIIISIIIFPFSQLFDTIKPVSILAITLLSSLFIWIIYRSFNYIHTVLLILGIDTKLLYWQVSGENVLHISRIMDMKQFKIIKDK